ncbi:hypothetical protein AB0O76_33600, partial [Streptomyces sp. NPDC086554]|uniref:hypothetical protein n=1 Tax=Streptomyces sp. NPDC086554 TaxID=3154864 RepID=UPI0034404A81
VNQAMLTSDPRPPRADASTLWRLCDARGRGRPCTGGRHARTSRWKLHPAVLLHIFPVPNPQSS